MIKIEHRTDILERFDDFPVFQLFLKYARSIDKYDLYVDRVTNPKTYLMHVPPAFVFHGEVNPDETESIRSIVPTGAWIIASSEAWDRYLLLIFEGRIQSYQRTAFDESHLDIQHMRSLKSRCRRVFGSSRSKSPIRNNG